MRHLVLVNVPVWQEFNRRICRDRYDPESERAANEVLSLPIFPELTRDQLDEVVAAVRGFYGR